MPRAGSNKGGYRCPECRSYDTHVVDSRTPGTVDYKCRRRECLACSHRFTTYELSEAEYKRLITARRFAQSAEKLLYELRDCPSDGTMRELPAFPGAA